MPLNVKNKGFRRQLNKAFKDNEFSIYPNKYLSNTSIVKVNKDDFLCEDEFIIQSSHFDLPRNIFIYGKKDFRGEDNIYLNYWMNIFNKTIESGIIIPSHFKKSDINHEISIGLSRVYRAEAYNYNNWTRENLIDFLSCLFDTEIKEVDYQQQDVFELMVA